MMKKLIFVVALIMIGLPSVAWAASDTDQVTALKKQVEKAKKQATTVGAELRTIANQFSLRPDIPKDFSKVSGEYCFFGGWDGHHTHYAIDPTKTQEDVIDFVEAAPMIKAGLNVKDLPKYPGKLGKMTPGQWYYSPAKGFEPHHGKNPPVALLIRAVNIK